MGESEDAEEDARLEDTRHKRRGRRCAVKGGRVTAVARPLVA
jgi:hypothetical protein